MTDLRGLPDLLPFLNWLAANKIGFLLEHGRDDAIMVTVSLIGVRVEIDFFDDHVEFSRFVGDESVELHVPTLLGLVRRDIDANAAGRPSNW